VKAVVLTAIVPELTFMVLLFVNAPVPARVELPVVVRPTVFTVPTDQLAVLVVRLTEPVLPAMVVMLLVLSVSV